MLPWSLNSTQKNADEVAKLGAMAAADAVSSVKILLETERKNLAQTKQSLLDGVKNKFGTYTKSTVSSLTTVTSFFNTLRSANLVTDVKLPKTFETIKTE